MILIKYPKLFVSALYKQVKTGLAMLNDAVAAVEHDVVSHEKQRGWKKSNDLVAALIKDKAQNQAPPAPRTQGATNGGYVNYRPNY